MLCMQHALSEACNDALLPQFCTQAHQLKGTGAQNLDLARCATGCSSSGSGPSRKFEVAVPRLEQLYSSNLTSLARFIPASLALNAQTFYCTWSSPDFCIIKGLLSHLLSLLLYILFLFPVCPETMLPRLCLPN